MQSSSPSRTSLFIRLACSTLTAIWSIEQARLPAPSTNQCSSKENSSRWCSVVCSSRCTLLLASGEARPGEDPNQRQTGELDGSSHDSATSAGTTCTSLASTPPTGPIGTGMAALGGPTLHHLTQGAHASRRQRPRQTGRTETEREFLPWHPDTQKTNPTWTPNQVIA